MGPTEYYFGFVRLIAAWPWDVILFVLKIFAVMVSAAALYWYIVTLGKMKTLIASLPVVVEPKQQDIIDDIVAKPWLEIQQKMASNTPADWSLAVIQADAVLDSMLKASGYTGDTMGDRLKQINSAELNAIDEVWRAHKIRNRLAHGTSGITRSEAEYAIRGYEAAFRELNYIE